MSTLVVCLMGPTASGKTALSLALASYLPVEIINVDSAQVYRYLDIGSAKPDAATLQAVPHHLINIQEPNQPYSAALFVEQSLACIKAIHSRGKLPLLVGGTMLYFKALQQGLSPVPPTNPQIRLALQQQLAQQGLDALYQQLKGCDPIAASQLKPNDTQRIQRALEVFLSSGMRFSDYLQQPPTPNSEYSFLNLGLLPLTTPRARLHEQVAKRWYAMIEQGLVAETQSLLDRGFAPDLPALRAVGYRQVLAYLQGHLTETQMHEQAIAANRQLVKRQLTWLRSWPNLVGMDFKTVELAEVLEQIKGAQTPGLR